jgi:hypothetical protein
MKSPSAKPEIAAALQRLAATYAQSIRKFEETLNILCHELNIQDIHWSQFAPSLPVALESDDQLVADRRSLSVRWRGRACFLGNTLLFRSFEKLALRPNRYCSHDELLADVWGGPRSTVSIRNVAKRLRDRLVRAGMKNVADAIDGTVRGHYALKLDRLA